MSQNDSSPVTPHPTGKLLNCRGRLLDLSKPVVMGILNISPDSFYDGGKFTEESGILKKAEELITGGAQIIDIGAASYRPGAEMIPESLEMERLIPALKLISGKFPDIFISVDTWRSSLVRAAYEHGAHIINDISGGLLDPQMASTVAETGLPYILMHMQGVPATMQKDPVYEDVVPEVLSFLQERVAFMRNLGIHDIIIDPGFGFGKTTGHNFTLLANLNVFQVLGCPILAGLSRKSMINKVLHIKPENALNGTSILNTLALLGGANILRVHDAKEATECIRLVEQYQSFRKWG
ncbi:MAG: dihydropteroate synthase [Bacteroidia bacterium]|nr:dihydropteroate synthase [Bacteroidia bacterium]